MKVPFVYQKLLELDDFKKKDLNLEQFGKVLLQFRISKKDWYRIAKDLNGFGLVDMEGKYQHIKIKRRRSS